MKHGKLALAAVVAVGAAVTFALINAWSTGPIYEGKSASVWFKLYRTSFLAEKEDARDAFKALGDQAAPYLLSVLTRDQRPSLVRSYGELCSRLPQSIRRLLPVVSNEDTDSSAAYALMSAARPSAKVLIPRLKPWLSSPKHPRYLLALRLLGTVGDGRAEGVPFLIQALQSTNRYHRAFAVYSLMNLGTEARAAVPALIAALDDPVTRLRAIKALGNIGPEAKEAVPHLETLLATTYRLPVAAALHKISPEGNGLRLLVEAARDPSLRLAAIEQLSELGPAALPAVDAVLEALKTEAGRDRVGGPQCIQVADALRKISPTNRAVIPVLLEKLKEAEELNRKTGAAGSVGMHPSGYLIASTKSDRLNIASRLVWFDPAEPHGLDVLVETLCSNPDPGQRDFAAYALRQAGPGARGAIPALRATLKDKDETVRRAAASALKKMETAEAR